MAGISSKCVSAGLANVKVDGEYLVKGKSVTGFSNTEEEGVGLTKVRTCGCHYHLPMLLVSASCLPLRLCML